MRDYSQDDIRNLQYFVNVHSARKNAFGIFSDSEISQVSFEVNANVDLLGSNDSEAVIKQAHNFVERTLFKIFSKIDQEKASVFSEIKATDFKVLNVKNAAVEFGLSIFYLDSISSKYLKIQKQKAIEDEKELETYKKALQEYKASLQILYKQTEAILNKKNPFRKFEIELGLQPTINEKDSKKALTIPESVLQDSKHLIGLCKFAMSQIIDSNRYASDMHLTKFYDSTEIKDIYNSSIEKNPSTVTEIFRFCNEFIQFTYKSSVNYFEVSEKLQSATGDQTQDNSNYRALNYGNYVILINCLFNILELFRAADLDLSKLVDLKRGVYYNLATIKNESFNRLQTLIELNNQIITVQSKHVEVSPKEELAQVIEKTIGQRNFDKNAKDIYAMVKAMNIEQQLSFDDFYQKSKETLPESDAYPRDTEFFEVLLTFDAFKNNVKKADPEHYFTNQDVIKDTVIDYLKFAGVDVNVTVFQDPDYNYNIDVTALKTYVTFTRKLVNLTEIVDISNKFMYEAMHHYILGIYTVWSQESHKSVADYVIKMPRDSYFENSNATRYYFLNLQN